MNAQVVIAVLVGLAAIVDDLWRRRISNWISATALAAGLIWQLSENGLPGILYGVGGAVVGFVVFLVFYVLGGMGGGDVKLMTGFGALLGAGRLLEAALWTAGVGGLLALGVLAVRAVRRKLTGKGSGAGLPEKLPEQEAERRESIPYAPAIALGVWLSLVPPG